MKYALILLAFASSVALSTCLPETTPPIMQVMAGPAGAPGATGDDGAQGDPGRLGDTVVVLAQR
jgi:hypothetical protein